MAIYYIRHRIGLSIFIIFASLYLLTAKGYMEYSDTFSSLRTAKAIIEDRSLAIDVTEDGRGANYKARDGRWYSKYGIGLAFLFIPYVVVGKSIASSTGLLEDRVVTFLISFYNIFFGAFVCVVMYHLAKFFNATGKRALMMASILGLATISWRYSVADFSESTQTFFLLLAIYLVLKNTPKSLIAASISCSLLILFKTIYILYLPIFILYIASKNRRLDMKLLRDEVYFLFFIAIGIFFLLFLNFIRFGNIFETGYGDEVNGFHLSGLSNVKQLLFFLDKGVFIYNPVLLLSILGYFKFFKLFRKEAILFLCIILLNLCIGAMWYGWYGGTCWGPRFLVPTVPLWLSPLLFVLDKKGFIKWVMALLIFVSFLIQLVSVLQSDNEYHYIRYHLIDETLKDKMPSDIIGSIILLKHKLLKRDNVYSLSEFGIDSDASVDTYDFATYRTLNLWYCQLARFFNKPMIKYIPLAILPFIGIHLVSLLRLVRRSDA